MTNQKPPYMRQLTRMAYLSVFLLISAISLILYYLSNDWLITSAIVIPFIYLVAYLIRYFSQIWLQPIIQLNSYLDAKLHGQNNLVYMPDDEHHPISMVGIKFQNLLDKENSALQPGLENLFQYWSHPVALFDRQLQLYFFNPPMQQVINMPILLGMNIEDCGFQLDKQSCTHTNLNEDWQIQHIKLPASEHHLVIANNISQPLRFAKQASQLSLIRVMTHELNNSLTPFASMADTLLANNILPEAQTREALTRIRNRSESLLRFINGYGQLHRLPEAKWREFNLKQLIIANAKEQTLNLEYTGYDNYRGDPILIEQLLINVLKNAKEAGADKVHVSNHSKGKWQCLTVSDNGPGFANLNNATQPLYTTKSDGNGLGLALCNAIALQHNGSLKVLNTTIGGQVELTTPNKE